MGGQLQENIASLFNDLIKKCVLWAPAFLHATNYKSNGNIHHLQIKKHIIAKD